MTRLEPMISGLDFPESPRWHQDELWFVDMQAQQLYRSGGGTAVVVATLADAPGGIGWRGAELVVVSMHARQLLSVEDGATDLIADLGPLAPGMCNDMFLSAAGHAYVGVMDDLRPPADPTCILWVRPDGTTAVATQDLLRPNGMGSSPDGRHLIVAESAGERLTAFELLADGSLGPGRCYAAIPGRRPDGMCVDRLGGVWIADLAGRAFVRVAPGGEVTDVISTGERYAVACALGGPDGRLLFACTCAHLRPFAGGPPGTGRIEVAEVAVPGTAIRSETG